MLSRGFWRGRRVFLTGHTGFKGSWTALWLQQLGAEITGYALAPPKSGLFLAARVADGMRSIEGDIRDRVKLSQCLHTSHAEIVLHFAAQALVRRSYDAPHETYEVNVMGTANVLETLRGCDFVRAAVVVTSDKCYRDRDSSVPYREEDPLGGRDPYSSSKACAELVTAAYRASFTDTKTAARVATVRAGNVFGGGDWAEDRLVPDIARALLADKPVRIRYPGAVRPWQHVLDPLLGYLMLAERLCAADGPKFAEAWNFGPEDRDARTVEQITRALVAMWDPPGVWRLDDAAHPPEVQQLRVDSTKARKRLGWCSRLPLDEGLRWTMEWYRAHRDGAELRAATTAQIVRYQQPAKLVS